MTVSNAILYGYRLSSCSWRVRAALHLKRVPFEERSVDIVRKRSQLTEEYRAINPAQKVPALLIDGVTLVDSMAIIGYLEDTRPEPALIPEAPLPKARMSEICQTVASGIQPLQNIGLKTYFNQDELYMNLSNYSCDRGLQTLEQLLGRTAGSYCVGDQLTVADLCLVPQIFNIKTRLEINLKKYRTVFHLYEKLMAENVFKETHPDTLRKLKSSLN